MNTTTIQNLPPNMITEILSFTDPKTACHFGRTCRKYHKWSNDNHLWKKFFKSDFQLFKSNTAYSWKTLYQQRAMLDPLIKGEMHLTEKQNRAKLSDTLNLGYRLDFNDSGEKILYVAFPMSINSYNIDDPTGIKFLNKHCTDIINNFFIINRNICTVTNKYIVKFSENETHFKELIDFQKCLLSETNGHHVALFSAERKAIAIWDQHQDTINIKNITNITIDTKKSNGAKIALSADRIFLSFHYEQEISCLHLKEEKEEKIQFDKPIFKRAWTCSANSLYVAQDQEIFQLKTTDLHIKEKIHKAAHQKILFMQAIESPLPHLFIYSKSNEKGTLECIDINQKQSIASRELSSLKNWKEIEEIQFSGKNKNSLCFLVIFSSKEVGVLNFKIKK